MAFAEVMSIVERIIKEGGYERLNKLIDASVKYKGNSDKMAQVLGYKNVDDFFENWVSYIKKQKLKSIPGITLEKPEIKRKSISERYFRLGEMLKDQRYFKTAAFEMEEAIKKKNLDSPVLYYKYAFDLINAKEFNKASTVLNKVIGKFPYYGGLHKLYGIVLAEAKEDKAAIREFEEALAINPFDPLIHVKLKELYKKSGNKKLYKRESDVIKVFLQYGGS